MAVVHQLFHGPAPPPESDITICNASSDSVTMDVESSRPSPEMIDTDTFGGTPKRGDTRIIVVVFGHGQDKIVSAFAEVLGKRCVGKTSFAQVTPDEQGLVVGIVAADARSDISSRDKNLIVSINTHCTSLGMPPDHHLSSECDYEFLYTDSPDLRRDLARFTSFTLGQTNHHEVLMAKDRTCFISTAFPDVRVALPNFDILTVGADAVELRVDLLQEPLHDDSFSEVPSLSYVGEQVMLLRQRTELPIIFTTRCTNENGRFPMNNPEMYYSYLYKAIQWGVEYVDVELWLPEEIRQALHQKRGNSRIISAFHDFSEAFKWPSSYAEDVFQRSIPYADIIKMIAIINEPNENFELEYFRCNMRIKYPNAPPLSAVNMGEIGQFSRTQNTIFTPITHPLLPTVAAPGQISAAEINTTRSLLGQLPKTHIYGISRKASHLAMPQAHFYGKCFNELGLPHLFSAVERRSKDSWSMETWFSQKDFGGAYFASGMSLQTLMRRSPFLSSLNGGTGPFLTEAVRALGTVDTIIVRRGTSSTASSPTSMPSSPLQHRDGSAGSTSEASRTSVASFALDNATWRGILSTLTRELAPSAYFGRSAVVLASTSDDAAPVFLALGALKVSKIYTVGFRASQTLAAHSPPIEQFINLESLQRARTVSNEGSPFVVVSTLGSEKGNLVSMLVRAFGAADSQGETSVRKVFLNLAEDTAQKDTDPILVAESNGFVAYDAADVAAFTTVERLRLLVGQNVPSSFVRLASGRSAF